MATKIDELMVSLIMPMPIWEGILAAFISFSAGLFIGIMMEMDIGR